MKTIRHRVPNEVLSDNDNKVQEPKITNKVFIGKLHIKNVSVIVLVLWLHVFM